MAREIVTQQRRAGRVIARLADAQHGSGGEQLGKVRREAGEECRHAPDRHAGADDGAADPTIGPQAEGQRAERIDQGEGAAEQTNAEVAEIELGLDERRDRGADPPIHVVQKLMPTMSAST